MGKSNSKMRKNEIVDWKISSSGGLVEPGSILGHFSDVGFNLTLRGKKVINDQEEKTKDKDFLNNENFVENEKVIGIFGRKGNLTIENVEVDNNNNFILTIKSGMDKYYMNWNRAKSLSFNAKDKFLRYGELNTTGKNHTLISKLCKYENCHNIQTDKYGNRSSTISMWGGDIYKYIINPITNRKVLIKGKLGKKILRKYLQK